MLTRIPATDPDAWFTPNGLVRRQRALSHGAQPIGVKRIRADIHARRLKASLVGNWYRVRWADFLEYLESMQIKADSTVEARVEQRVEVRIRRENTLPP